MDKTQLIITVGREFGSGGQEIARKLAEHYDLPLYDKNLLKEVLENKGITNGGLEQYDEKHRHIGIYRTVRDMDSSPEASVANVQFEYLKKKAKEGESFVVVGRCAETMLKECPAMISVFVLGDRQEKIERVVRIYHLSPEEAEKLMAKKDHKRKKYHNSYCEGKWGDSRNYDISINSSKLGVDETMKILTDYIDARRKKW